MNHDLAPILSALPEPPAPSSMTTTVMARIEREAAARQANAAEPLRPRMKRDVSTWVTACVGMALVFGATASGWYVHGVPNIFSPQVLRGGLSTALVGWQAYAVGLIGLVLCLRALFAPLRSR